jgi:hypothetical protein
MSLWLVVVVVTTTAVAVVTVGSVVVVAIGAEAVKECELLYDHCNCCKTMSSHGAAAYNTISQ